MPRRLGRVGLSWSRVEIRSLGVHVGAQISTNTIGGGVLIMTIVEYPPKPYVKLDA